MAKITAKAPTPTAAPARVVASTLPTQEQEVALARYRAAKEALGTDEKPGKVSVEDYLEQRDAGRTPQEILASSKAPSPDATALQTKVLELKRDNPALSSEEALKAAGRELRTGITPDITAELKARRRIRGAVAQTRAEATRAYAAWAKQFTSAEVREIESGKFRVPDTRTGRLTPTTKAFYDRWTAAGSPSAVQMLISGDVDRGWLVARDVLQGAGFVDELPTGASIRAAGPSLRTFTIPNLAAFVRRNPATGVQTLRDFGFDNKVLAGVSSWNKKTVALVAYLDKGVQPTGTGLSSGLGLSSTEISVLGRALSAVGVKPVGGSYVEAWRNLDEDTKRQVARVFSSDPSKDDPISALARDVERVIPIPTGTARDIALDITPILGTIRYAERAGKDGFTAGEIAWLSTFAALDVITLAIGFGAAGAGARATVGAGRGARMGGALKGLGRFALAEVKAPYTMVRHPVETAKAVYRPFAALVSPKAIPLAAVETSYSTLRIPVKSAAGDTEAIRAIREAVTDAAIRGKSAKVTIGGTTVSLEPTILKKVGAPVAVHTTPDVRPFMDGAVVRSGRERGLYLAPDVHTRFSYASGFGDLPKGGIKGALLIRDERVLKAISPSKKLYRGTAEVEVLLPKGTKIPAPSQVLFTRDSAGNKLSLLVIGKPFTKLQVANLKLTGGIENIYQMFNPAIRISRSERAGIKALDEMIDLTKQREKLIANIARYRKAGNARRVAQAEGSLNRLSKRLATLRPRVQSGLGSRAIGRASILWAQYTPSGVLDRWDDLTGRRSRLSDVNGVPVRRLPGVDARRIDVALPYPPPRTLTRATIPEEERVIPPREREVPVTPDITLLGRPPTRPPTEGSPTRRTPPRVPATTTTIIRPPTRPPTEGSPTRVPPRAPPSTPSTKVLSPIAPPTLSSRAKIVGNQARLPEGSIAWRQGMFWKWIPRQDFTSGKKPRTLRKGITPMGATLLHLKTPQDTIQMIGRSGARVPNISIDLGIADIFIKNNARNINYTGKGEQTNVGTGIDSPTKGMTVGGVNRATMSKEAPPRTPKVARLLGGNRTEIAEEPLGQEGLEYPDEASYGTYGDEQPLQQRPTRNRIRNSRKQPSRKRRRDTPSSTMGGVRL